MQVRGGCLSLDTRRAGGGIDECNMVVMLMTITAAGKGLRAGDQGGPGHPGRGAGEDQVAGSFSLATRSHAGPGPFLFTSLVTKGHSPYISNMLITMVAGAGHGAEPVPAARAKLHRAGGAGGEARQGGAALQLGRGGPH
jgi:hypothetical protein